MLLRAIISILNNDVAFVEFSYVLLNFFHLILVVVFFPSQTDCVILPDVRHFLVILVQLAPFSF